MLGAVQRGDTVAGKYRLVRRIGAGGMGVVWEARHLVTDRPFAIKFLLGPAHEDHHARFVQEARVSGFVRHPSIVDVYDVGTAAELGKLPFLVMDLLDGSSLGDLLGATKRLGVEETISVMLPIVSAIAAAHEAGVVHRDLKPSNLFLHRMPTGAVLPKVLDFGISKLVGPARSSASEGEPARRPLTRTGTVLGSPLYMSPEQVRGDMTLDARSDIHALGAILWECLAGESLFSVDLDDHELASQIANGARRSVSELLPACPPELAAAVNKAIALQREQRFATALEMATELERLHDLLAPDVTLSDPKQARRLLPALFQAPVPKSLECATTVDSSASPSLGGTPLDPPRSRRTSDSRSIEGWVDRSAKAAQTRAGRTRAAAVFAAGAFALVVVGGLVGDRMGTAPVSASSTPAAALPSPQPAPAPIPPAVIASVAVVPIESADAAGSPLTTVTTVATVATPRPGRPSASTRPSPPPARDAGRLESSANGAPILR